MVSADRVKLEGYSDTHNSIKRWQLTKDSSVIRCLGLCNVTHVTVRFSGMICTAHYYFYI